MHEPLIALLLSRKPKTKPERVDSQIARGGDAAEVRSGSCWADVPKRIEKVDLGEGYYGLGGSLLLTSYVPPNNAIQRLFRGAAIPWGEVPLPSKGRSRSRQTRLIQVRGHELQEGLLTVVDEGAANNVNPVVGGSC